MRILIIGGAGAFGSFYARFLSNAGHEVGIFDASLGAAQTLCKQETYTLVPTLAQAKTFDCIILSVPNTLAPKVLKDVEKVLKKGTLIIDFCSVKAPLAQALTKLAKKGTEVLSLHPMHGPRVSSITGQSIALISLNPGAKTNDLLALFEKNHALLIPTTFSEHDALLSVVQGLTHYTQFVAARTLHALATDIKKTSQLSSPNYALFLSLIARVILQNPTIYADIQLANPNNAHMRTIFSQQAKELEKICSKNDAPLLAQALITSAQQFKDAELLLIEGDKLVAAQTTLLTKLESFLSKKILIENMLTHSLHFGTLLKVTPHELVLQEHTHELTLALAKVRVATKSEVHAWKETHLTQQLLDFSILVPKTATSTTIVDAVTTSTGYVATCIDEFTGAKIPTGQKSITLRVYFFIDSDKKEVQTKVMHLLTQLGYVPRA